MHVPMNRVRPFALLLAASAALALPSSAAAGADFASLPQDVQRVERAVLELHDAKQDVAAKKAAEPPRRRARARALQEQGSGLGTDPRGQGPLAAQRLRARRQDALGRPATRPRSTAPRWRPTRPPSTASSDASTSRSTTRRCRPASARCAGASTTRPPRPTSPPARPSRSSPSRSSSSSPASAPTTSPATCSRSMSRYVTEQRKAAAASTGRVRRSGRSTPLGRG